MQTFLTLFLILLPLLIGFMLPKSEKLLHYSDLGIRWLVFVILTYIGIELSHIEGFGSQLGQIAGQVALLFVLTVGSGLLALLLLDVCSPWHNDKQQDTKEHKVSIRGSLVQLMCVAFGFTIGKFFSLSFLPDNTVTGLLMMLVFMVGIDLKGSGITLKEVFINKRGVQMSIIFTIAVLLSGVAYAWLVDEVSIYQGLAMASGFGWYSLSGVVMTDAYGAIWGSVALFNDLLREFCALIFIPIIIRKFPSTGIGLGGVTTLDFTLPIIQQSGGLKVVPMTISFGFITNIISPIMMVLFSSLG